MYNGVVGAGFDNIQIHNRALREEEIQYTAAGYMLLDSSCVLALDFNQGIVNGVIPDVSGHSHHAAVHGNPSMESGGLPEKDYAQPPEPTTDYSGVD